MYSGVPTAMPLAVSDSGSAYRDRLRDAEVRDHGLSAGEQDVARLDVAMYHVVLVGVVQRLGDVAGDLDRLADRQLLFPRDPMAKRLALDVGHDVVQ